MSTGLTVEQLAASNMAPSFLAVVLRDEQQRGHVERGEDGTWRAVPGFAARYADAFIHLYPATSTEGRRATDARIATTR